MIVNSPKRLIKLHVLDFFLGSFPRYLSRGSSDLSLGTGVYLRSENIYSSYSHNFRAWDDIGQEVPVEGADWLDHLQIARFQTAPLRLTQIQHIPLEFLCLQHRFCNTIFSDHITSEFTFIVLQTQDQVRPKRVQIQVLKAWEDPKRKAIYNRNRHFIIK